MFKSVKKNKIKINKKINKIVKPFKKPLTFYMKKLYKFDFANFFNDKKFEITEEYIQPFVKQLENIYKTFKDNNLYHNEMRNDHFLFKKWKNICYRF